jgi:hypothetical protein
MSADFVEWLQSEIVTLDALIEKKTNGGAGAVDLAAHEALLGRYLVAWDLVIEHDVYLKGVSGS